MRPRRVFVLAAFNSATRCGSPTFGEPALRAAWRVYRRWTGSSVVQLLRSDSCGTGSVHTSVFGALKSLAFGDKQWHRKAP